MSNFSTLIESIKIQTERNEHIKKNFLDVLNTVSFDLTAKQLMELCASIVKVVPVESWYCPPRGSSMYDFLYLERHSIVTCEVIFESAIDLDTVDNRSLGLDTTVNNFPTVVEMIKIFLDKGFVSGFIYDW